MTNQPKIIQFPRKSVRLEIHQKLQDILGIGQQELDNDDDTGQFYEQLIEFIEMHNRDAVEAIEDVLKQHKYNSYLLSDVLSALGDASEPVSYQQRLNLLHNYLFNDTPRIRYGAMIGLSSLKDPQSLPLLERALKEENVGMLQTLLQQIITRFS